MEVRTDRMAASMLHAFISLGVETPRELNELNMILIIDLCEMGKTSVGNIEGGSIENKITALSRVNIKNKKIGHSWQEAKL